MKRSEEPRSSRMSGRCRVRETIQLIAPVVLAGFLVLACTISPSVTVPEAASPRYTDCHHAARSYCEAVIRASGDDLERCVADQTLRCVSGRPE